MFNLKSKVLFGVSVSMVLAMAIGSFALSETQTTASPRAVEAQNAVGATAGSFTVEGGTQGTNFDYTSPVLTIHSGNLTISTTAQTNERIVVDGAATITLKNVNISTDSGAALQIQDNATFDVNILLADGSNNILKGKAGSSSSDLGSPGIQKNGEGDNIGTLTIGVPDGSQGTGKLEATGGYYAAGIGGGYEASGSNITINSGEVTVTGGFYAAGIGGGERRGNGSNITISGGVVTAYGGKDGAGIGGGNDSGDGDGITITGGVVTAKGAGQGAGIGAGYYGDGKNIRISGGIVTAIAGFKPSSMDGAAGIGGGYYGEGDGITISGGEVTATGGHSSGAGIGGGYNRHGQNITISGGIVNATGGKKAAGIGGGDGGWGREITIRGGVVRAYGGGVSSSYETPGAGIGGRTGKDIRISGGVIMAYGGKGDAPGIGSADDSVINNTLNGDAVVLATSGSTTKPALEGFVDDQGGSLITKGIAFTGVGTAFDSDDHATAFSWDESGTMYGDSVMVTENAEFPANFTIEEGKEITLEAGKTLTISAGATLTNEGTLNIGEGGNITCQYDEATGTTGKVTTKTDFYLEGSTDIYTTGYQTYQTSAGVQKYTNLPNPDDSNDTVFDSWFTKPGGPDGGGTKVDETIDVLLNDHSFYEHRVVAEYTITVADLENGSITPDVTEAAKDDTVTLTVTPAEGYQLKEGSLTVTDADGNEVPVTEQDGKYTFTMPDSEVEISAEFELIPEPSVDPDQDGGGSSKTGDSFTGIAALAILGLATTGAVMLRKRK